ncbi:killer cell lectin-like receptor subfamily F member 1 isoform X2 [Erythrolamprus reginae]|uniref:killer cell lectin-like receptor subfamily F member 1 isoform X2 n=1 Tax=Erythrolamprus reginae TaxID=121349 RepID=UPI00396C6D23
MNWKLLVSQIFPEDPKITSPGKTSCRIRWILYEGNCFHFSTLKKTWDESQKQCVSLNSHLVMINSKAELAFLNSNTLNEDYFIGLRWINSNEQWKWIDNTKFDPNIFNVRGKTNGCVAIGLNSTVSRSCSQLNRFICEEKV